MGHVTYSISMSEARKSFAYLLNLAIGGDRIIVERRGNPVAALISIENLKELERWIKYKELKLRK